MATCVRCPHLDDRHVATLEGGLAACRDCACDVFFETVTRTDDLYACGRCGGVVFDYGLHITHGRGVG